MCDRDLTLRVVLAARRTLVVNLVKTPYGFRYWIWSASSLILAWRIEELAAEKLPLRAIFRNLRIKLIGQLQENNCVYGIHGHLVCGLYNNDIYSALKHIQITLFVQIASWNGEYSRSSMYICWCRLTAKRVNSSVLCKLCIGMVIHKKSH